MSGGQGWGEGQGRAGGTCAGVLCSRAARRRRPLPDDTRGPPGPARGPRAGCGTREVPSPLRGRRRRPGCQGTEGTPRSEGVCSLGGRLRAAARTRRPRVEARRALGARARRPRAVSCRRGPVGLSVRRPQRLAPSRPFLEPRKCSVRRPRAQESKKMELGGSEWALPPACSRTVFARSTGLRE